LIKTYPRKGYAWVAKVKEYAELQSDIIDVLEVNATQDNSTKINERSVRWFWQLSITSFIIIAASPYHFDLRHRGHDRADGVVFQCAHKSLYQIENFQCQTYMTKTPMPIGILRGIIPKELIK
jgi:hypothetical protein